MYTRKERVCGLLYRVARCREHWSAGGLEAHLLVVPLHVGFNRLHVVNHDFIRIGALINDVPAFIRTIAHSCDNKNSDEDSKAHTNDDTDNDSCAACRC